MPYFSYSTESEIYNKTDGDGWCYIAKCVKTKDKKCNVIKLSVPCLTTMLPSASMPLTGNCDKHMPPLKVSTFIIEAHIIPFFVSQSRFCFL